MGGVTLARGSWGSRLPVRTRVARLTLRSRSARETIFTIAWNTWGTNCTRRPMFSSLPDAVLSSVAFGSTLTLRTHGSADAI